jgi:hypothetical protein
MPAKPLKVPSLAERGGFALPLMAMMIVVLTMIAATALLDNDVNRRWGGQVDMQAQLMQISKAMLAFQRTNHRLPCVAPLTLAVNAAAVTAATSTGTTSLRHGQELPECSHASGLNATLQGTRRINVGGRFVRIGALPTFTLGISPSLGIDRWKSRILYAVTEDFTDPYLFATSTGRIAVQRSGVTVMSNAAYILVAHGPDRKGAFAGQTGVSSTACTGTGIDLENCDTINAVFAEGDVQFEAGTGFYDDNIHYELVDTDATTRNRPCTTATSGTAIWSVGGATCTNASWPRMLSGQSQSVARTGGPSSSGSVTLTCTNGALSYSALSCLP